MASTIETNRYASAFTRRTVLTWLLAANGIVFLALRIVAAIGVLTGHGGWGDAAISAVSLPSLPAELLSHPWTLLTYMVSQYDPLHLMFNMLWLAWFGILVQLTLGNRRLLAFYCAGGLAGAAAYMLWTVFAAGTATSAGLAGSSAAVISVAVAIAVIEPDHRVGLLFIGPVKLKWVTVIMIAISALLFSGYSGGTDAAHIGGAVAGAVCGVLCRVRRRNRFVARPFIPRVPEPAPSSTPVRPTDTEALDFLLDKIRRSGFNSLSATEKTTLFDLSAKLKDKQSQTTR